MRLHLQNYTLKGILNNCKLNPKQCKLLRYAIAILGLNFFLMDISLIIRAQRSHRYTLDSERDHNFRTFPIPANDVNKSALQLVKDWSNYTIIKENRTVIRHDVVTDQASSNKTEPPWRILKGMLLDHSLRMPNNKDLYFRRLDHRINQFDYPFRFAPRDLCSDKTEFIVLIHSRADFTQIRADLRTTWVGAVSRGEWPGQSLPLPEIKVVFMVAEFGNQSVMSDLHKEAQEYNDIVLCGFQDSYYNMTIKSIMGLKFVAEECSRARFILKVDDDVIINWPYLIETLKSFSPRNLMLGPINPSSKVGRDWGKWAVPRKLYPLDRYPPYLSGAAYVISGDLAPLMVAAAPFVPAFHVDDVYVTGVLAKVIGVKPKGRRGFAYWGSKKPTSCSIYKNKIITGTKVTDEYRLLLWKELHDPANRKKC